MAHIIGLLAGILAGVAIIPYVIDMLRGRARPERATWFIWLVLALIAFGSQLAQGATNSLWLTGFDTVGVLVVFSLSTKYGVGGFTKRDSIALIAAAIGLLLWYVTRHAIIALGIVIAIDALGTSLTVVKTYHDPSSETYLMWLLVGVAGLMTMFAVGSFNIGLLVYPLYIFLANSAVILAMWAGKLHTSHSNTAKLR
jgi:hypothetical protein